MSQVIKPLRATRYNPLRIKDFSDVVCPPYDVIDAAQFKTLRKKSPYNFARILLARPHDKNYDANRRQLDAWLKQRVLVDDDRESLYLYEQTFKIANTVRKRYGIISLLKMDAKNIFPHERTHKGPKDDRKKIIKTLEANLSPVFIIASKPVRQLYTVYKHYCLTKPLVVCKDRDNNHNRLWKITDPTDIALLAKAFENIPMLIADGHHRFEISYDYFRRHPRKFKDLNYVLAFVTDAQKGLVILPTHRIMKLAMSDAVLFAALSKLFYIRQMRQADLERRLALAKYFSLGLYHKGKFYFLQLKNKKILDKIPEKLFRPLDTYVFHKLVLPQLKVKGALQYTHSVSEAKSLAAMRKSAFLLRAARLDAVVKISSKGFRLPQKSTYFYPKLLSGLVMRRFAI